MQVGIWQRGDTIISAPSLMLPADLLVKRVNDVSVRILPLPDPVSVDVVENLTIWVLTFS